MPTPATVLTLDRRDRDEAAVVLTKAFLREPWLRWAFAECEDPAAALRGLQELSVDIRLGMGWPLLGARVDGRLVGVAGASVPGSGPWPEKLDAAYAELCRSIGPVATERIEIVGDLEHAHRPPGNNCEVGVIGVLPSAQRRGIGGQLLAALHTFALGLPGTTGTYLATTDPNNVQFYRGAGYEMLFDTPIAKGVGFWAMYRPHDSADTRHTTQRAMKRAGSAAGPIR